jgi:hypothetical protein
MACFKLLCQPLRGRTEEQKKYFSHYIRSPDNDSRIEPVAFGINGSDNHYTVTMKLDYTISTDHVPLFMQHVY